VPFREVELYQHNLETAAASALDLLSEIIGVDTLFVATNDGKTNHIIKALNRDQKLVEEGSSLPFFDTYCSLVVTGLDPVLVIPDTSDSTLTCSMEVTKTLGPTSFIGVPIILPNGEPVGTICGMDRHGYQFTSRDQELLKRVAKLFSYVAGLERIAYRDGLTGAYSREFLYTNFAKTFKDQYDSAAFMFLDLDDFKTINDQHGHSSGDEVLRIVVKRIEARIREGNFVFRIGGDEFLVVVADYGSEQLLETIATTIIENVMKPIKTTDSILECSISIGISTFPHNGKDIDTLIDLADQAMYRSKSAGKNTYRFA
jgi:diguanylate cyclase (GGDEF)-like protein